MRVHGITYHTAAILIPPWKSRISESKGPCEVHDQMDGCPLTKHADVSISCPTISSVAGPFAIFTHGPPVCCQNETQRTLLARGLFVGWGHSEDQQLCLLGTYKRDHYSTSTHNVLAKRRHDYATSWLTNESGFDSWQGQEISLFSTASRLWGPHNFLFNGSRGPFSWGKAAGTWS
jgi:hypothetical protein